MIAGLSWTASPEMPCRAVTPHARCIESVPKMHAIMRRIARCSGRISASSFGFCARKGGAGSGCGLFRLWRQCLGLVAAQIGDRAAPAFGGARLADVAAVEDQPMVRADAERRRDLFFELFLDREGGLVGRKAGAGERK